MNSSKNIDHYTEVTNQIIIALENNTKPWIKPWCGGVLTPQKRYNGDSYQGVNTLILWGEASKKQHNSSFWMTFKQAKLFGRNVKKGEKSTSVFYSGVIKNKKDEEKPTKQDLTEKENYRKFMKSYSVFNASQIDNLSDEYYIKPEEENQNKELKKLPELEAFIAKTKAKIKHDAGNAYYREKEDYIQMPKMQLFKSVNAYYATLCHELTHWTKHKTRLDRDLGGKRFGDNGYAMEELVAELGAAFLSVGFGIVPDVRDDHVPYIANWLEVLKSDKKAIFTAASLAQKAANYLLGKE